MNWPRSEWCSARDGAVRSMASTSGPGISLMSEFAGLGYFAEIPGVIFDVQRTGPSTGMPTRTSQADLLSTAFLSHGDTKHIVLLPGSVKECFEFGYSAFDLSERLQTPVFVLTDLDLGMNNWMSEQFEYPEKPLDRGKVLTAADLERLGGFARYRDVDGDAIGWRTLPGTRHPKAAYFTRGSGHNDAAGPREARRICCRDGAAVAQVRENARETGSCSGYGGERHLACRFPGLWDYRLCAAGEPRPDQERERRRCGLHAHSMRILSRTKFTTLLASHDRVYVVEQDRECMGLASLLKLDLPADQVVKLRSILHYNGLPIDARTITEEFVTKEGL